MTCLLFQSEAKDQANTCSVLRHKVCVLRTLHVASREEYLGLKLQPRFMRQIENGCVLRKSLAPDLTV